MYFLKIAGFGLLMFVGLTGLPFGFGFGFLLDMIKLREMRMIRRRRVNRMIVLEQAHLKTACIPLVHGYLS